MRWAAPRMPLEPQRSRNVTSTSEQQARLSGLFLMRLEARSATPANRQSLYVKCGAMLDTVKAAARRFTVASGQPMTVSARGAALICGRDGKTALWPNRKTWL